MRNGTGMTEMQLGLETRDIPMAMADECFQIKMEILFVVRAMTQDSKSETDVLIAVSLLSNSTALLLFSIAAFLSFTIHASDFLKP